MTNRLLDLSIPRPATETANNLLRPNRLNTPIRTEADSANRLLRPVDPRAPSLRSDATLAGWNALREAPKGSNALLDGPASANDLTTGNRLLPSG
jgi:hypothetical protein